MSSGNPYETPVGAARSEVGIPGIRRLHLKSIDPLAAGKVLGVFYALLGLIVGLFMSVVGLIGMAAGGDAAIGGLITGVSAIIFIPLLYGVFGFIGGLIAALLYNLVAGMVGGFVLELEG